jgi:hypothetical protein
MAMRLNDACAACEVPSARGPLALEWISLDMASRSLRACERCYEGGGSLVDAEVPDDLIGVGARGASTRVTSATLHIGMSP